MPSVDVVVPCYNYAHFLAECVHSIQAQGIDALRIIVIDNASTDDSVEVARKLAKADSRIEIICHQVNLGSHASFNEGIDLAKADYFLILCADDLLAPGALKAGVALLERYPQASFVLGQRMAPWAMNKPLPLPEHGEDDKLVCGTSLIERCCKKMKYDLPAHAMLVRTSVQKAVGHYRPSVPLLDDMEMALRLAHNGSVAQLRGPLAITREHTSNISQVMWNDSLRRLQEYQTVFDSFFGHEGSTMPNAASLHRTVRRHLAAAAYWSAISHLIQGRRGAGVELLKFSRRLNPNSTFLPPMGHLFWRKDALERVRAAIWGSFRNSGQAR